VRESAARHCQTRTGRQCSLVEVHRSRSRALSGRARRQIPHRTIKPDPRQLLDAASTGHGIQVGKVSDISEKQQRSKKTLILEYREAHALKHAGIPELKAIQRELQACLGDRGESTPSYIAQVLRSVGTQVDTGSGSGGSYVHDITEPYAARLSGLLQFADFAAAERSLRNLDAAHREYVAAADYAGARFVRALALKGRLRAQSLARNARVNPEKREEKQEIANWFRVWLQSPDLFSDWLELRKRSQEFQRKFGSREVRAINEQETAG
jgi:hypothetical protein